MDAFTDMMRARLQAFIRPGEEIIVAFLASDFETSTIDGGSTRIVAVTEREIIVVRAGLLRRTSPIALSGRRSLKALANPMFAWPGRSLYGENLAEILPGLWVHRRYQDAVFRAFGVAVRAVA